MKICNQCKTNQPDNFVRCAHCGVSLTEQPSGGVPMRLYMYNREMGKKIGAMEMGEMIAPIIISSIVIAVLFVAVVPLMLLNTEEPSFGLMMLVALIAAGAVIAVGLVFQSKRPKNYIAYMFYGGVIYKLVMYPKHSGRYNRGAMYREHEQRAANVDLYIRLFEQYLAGAELWNRRTGGIMYIEPLNKLQITSANGKYFAYTYVTQNGQAKSGKIDNAYPGIEEIFPK